MVAETSSRRVLRKKIKKATFGVTDALVNVALYSLYISFSIKGGAGPAGIHRTFNEADELIGQLDAKKVRKALSNLAQKGFIKSIKDEVSLYKITKAGLDRIKRKFPIYEEKRYWDGKLYIINYDIPTEFNSKRDIFRNNLKLLKTANLQKSVYLTPYNPRGVIGRIVEEYKIKGQILVSTLDPKDAFGAVDIKELIWDIYNLDNRNQGYFLFLNKYKNISPLDAKRIKMQIAFSFVSAVQSDPQLPFELLSDKYLGDEAYLLYKKLIRV